MQKLYLIYKLIFRSIKGIIYNLSKKKCIRRHWNTTFYNLEEWWKTFLSLTEPRNMRIKYRYESRKIKFLQNKLCK